MTDEGNAWLSRPARLEPAPPALVTSVPTTFGPTGPQRGVPVPDQVDQLPARDQARPSELWWVGVHGGSGESTLAALSPAWGGADHAWPRMHGYSSRVVLVARSNGRGLRAAQAAMQQWAAGLVPFVDVLGLVIMADAPGRLPRTLRDQLQVLSGGVPRTWTLPWVEAWREGQPPPVGSAPRDVRRLFEKLATIINAVPPAPRNER